ncbi:GNAT family N-acetyltransferase [Nocardia sp. NPDC127579]|uniref:GNAT family N-acetyltransferase n=1 Tax=Nocardia sp. NPDC127579 TaxID=3345402 RepID=UPI00362E832E
MTDAARPALVIGPARREEWATVVEWAQAEGWTPGEDAVSFFAQDPDGFFLGRIGGEPVSAVSVVNYGAEYAFLGFYLVRPDLRGQGLGIATWRAGLAHAGSRVVGLDGVPDQQDNYRRSGFELAYRSARFSGVPRLPAPDATVRAFTPEDAALVHAYDSDCVPADRPRFLGSWLGDPRHKTVVRIVDGRLTGFGTIRPARGSMRIGPLFADSDDDARHLLAALADGPLAVDVPLCNEPAVQLVEKCGLTSSFETARMYTGPVRQHRVDRVFGTTTLELG